MADGKFLRQYILHRVSAFGAAGCASRNSWINKKQLLKQDWKAQRRRRRWRCSKGKRIPEIQRLQLPPCFLWPADPSYFSTFFRWSAPTLTFPPGSIPRLLVSLSQFMIPERMASKFSYIMQIAFSLHNIFSFLFTHSSIVFQTTLHCLVTIPHQNCISL